jgi:hypothetical protein
VEDWQHRNFDPHEGPIDSGQWQIHLALNPEEREAIKRAAPLVIPAENFEIHTELEDGDEGESVLAVRVFAETAEQAVNDAKWILTKIRQEAQLPNVPSLALGYISPQWRQSAARHMGKEATDLLLQGRDSLAVIRAGTTCELLIADTFRNLLGLKHPDVDPNHLIRRPANLTDKNSKALLHLLSGKRVQDSSWWPAFATHRSRRNAIIHEGIAVSHENAQESIGVMNDLHKWLLDVYESALNQCGIPMVDVDGELGNDA